MWDAKNAYALADVNADNFRLTNQWFEYDKAKSVGDLRRASAKVQGNPWVNVIAADSARPRLLRRRLGGAERRRCAAVAARRRRRRRCCSAPGVILLDGSSEVVRVGQRPRRGRAGILGPKALPRATRRDYVENSNDSYWLPSAFPASRASRASSARRARSALRTRLGLVQAEQRLAEHGRPRPGRLHDRHDEGGLQRQPQPVRRAGPHRGRRLRRERRGGPGRGVRGAGRLGRARRHRLARRGAVARGVVAAVVAGVPWTVPFDPADPVNTPRDLDASDPKVTDALRGAVEDLRAKGIALDVPLGDKQAEPRGAERIGIPAARRARAASTSSRPAVTSRATTTRSPAPRSSAGGLRLPRA